MRGLGSILTGGKILLLDFFLFSRSKASDVNVGIIADFVYYGKTRTKFFVSMFRTTHSGKSV